MTLFGTKLQFSNPPLVDKVVFYEVNNQLIQKIIKPNETVFILRPNLEEIWLGLRTLRNFFFLLSGFKVSDINKSSKSFLKAIFWQVLCIYLKACLLSSRPKAVLTYIDDCDRFGWLARNCYDFPFISVQNGFRLTCDSSSTNGYYAQHLFCYGQREEEVFPKIGYEVKNFYPVGSLVASLNFTTELETKNDYDILVVSCWRGNIGFDEGVRATMLSMKIMDQKLAKYITKENLRAAIILRSERDSNDWFMPEVGKNEEEYYQSIYGKNVEIIETNFVLRNIFPLMQKSNLIISTLSTALVEAFGIGKKVLFCNFLNTNHYHEDFNPKILFSGTNEESDNNFFRRIDETLSIPDSEYFEENRDLMNFYMSYPNSALTLDVIKEKIEEIIDSFKLPQPNS